MTWSGDWWVNGSGMDGIGFSRKAWVGKFFFSLNIFCSGAGEELSVCFCFCICSSVNNTVWGRGVCWQNFAWVRAGGYIISMILILLL